jgi:hypothetical protein
MMQVFIHLHYYHLKCLWRPIELEKEKWSWNGNTTMWGYGYHAKICTKVVSMVCLYEIIISYYFYMVLLEAKIGKKRVSIA